MKFYFKSLNTIIFIVCCSVSWICNPSIAQETSPMDILLEHKIDFETPSLLKFLEEGFPQRVNWSGFPKNPPEKTQLLIYAIQEMGKRHKKEAVPLLIKYADLDLPKGAAQIVQHDIETFPINEREREQSRLYSYLRYNTLNSLGWIRDKEALPVVKKYFLSETQDIVKIQYALNLGMLGDTESIDYLVKIIQKDDHTESVLAATNLFYLTGVNAGISMNTSAAKRREQAKAVNDWWIKNKEGFKIDTGIASKRRLETIDDTPKVPEGSIRALLLASSYYLDFTNKYKSYDAREELKKRGESLLPEYEKIALDVYEDLRIRSEAIRKYYSLKQKKSKHLLKKLLKDENPQIVELSDKLLKQIKESK